MSDIEFRDNEFRIYKTRVEGISFGFVGGAYTPLLGENFTYDGNTVVLKDGREYVDVPQLRSAIREGWFVEVDGGAVAYKPRASIKVRGTQLSTTGAPVREAMTTVFSEEDPIALVEDRTARRELADQAASKAFTLRTPEAQQAVQQRTASTPAPTQTSAPRLNEEVSSILGALDEEMLIWSMRKSSASRSPGRDVRARAEADVLMMIDSLDHPTPRIAKTELASRGMPVEQEGARYMDRGDLPLDVAPATPRPVPRPQAQEGRLVMPIERDETLRRNVSPDVSEGQVVAQVGTAWGKRPVEWEQDRVLNIAPASPQQSSPRPSPRFGGAGAIVVDEEQRHVGNIGLSDNRAPIRMEDTARVSPGSTEMVKLGGVEVGGRASMRIAPPSGMDGGITVGRIATPASREARDVTTADPSIEDRRPFRAKIEKFSVATGDVEEARSGENLEELFPDAAVGPTPQVYLRPEDDRAYAAVRLFLPDFQWNKDRPTKERVAEALSRAKDTNFIRGVMAVETDLVKEDVRTGLAELIEKRKKGKKAGKDSKE